MRAEAALGELKVRTVTYEAEDFREKSGSITYFIPDDGPEPPDEGDASARAAHVRWDYSDGSRWFSPGFPDELMLPDRQLLRDLVNAVEADDRTAFEGEAYMAAVAHLNRTRRVRIVGRTQVPR